MGPNMQAELEKRFTYYEPKGDQEERYKHIRAAAKEFAELILASTSSQALRTGARLDWAPRSSAWRASGVPMRAMQRATATRWVSWERANHPPRSSSASSSGTTSSPPAEASAE